MVSYDSSVNFVLSFGLNFLLVPYLPRLRKNFVIQARSAYANINFDLILEVSYIKRLLLGLITIGSLSSAVHAKKLSKQFVFQKNHLEIDFGKPV